MKTINFFSAITITAISFLFINTAYAKPVNWRIAESWPENFPFFGEVVENMATNVERLSNGEFKIKIVPKGEHKRALKVFEMVQEGEFEMAHTSAHYWKSRDINTGFFTALPMGMVMAEKYAWFYHGGGLELMQKVFSKHKLLSYPGGNTGTQMGGWFKKEIKTLEDFKGLRIRLPGIAAQALKNLGAEPVNIPGGELYEALKTDKIQALEYVGPAMDYSRKYHEVANYYYTGWHAPGSELQFLVNKDSFEQLSAQFQNILITSMRLAAYDMFPHIYHKNAEVLDIILKEHPEVKIRAFPTRIFRALANETRKEIDQIALKGDDLTREIVQSRHAYLSKVRKWTRISDQAFLNSAVIIPPKIQ